MGSSDDLVVNEVVRWMSDSHGRDRESNENNIFLL